jgi:hypothetical protein
MFEISIAPAREIVLHRRIAHTPLLTLYEGEVGGRRVALEVLLFPAARFLWLIAVLQCVFGD